MNNTIIKVLSGITLAIGMWLVVSPFFFGYSVYSLWSSVIAGGLAIIMAGIVVWGADRENNWANWGNTILGIALVGASFVIGESGLAFWSLFASGAVTTVLSAWNATTSQPYSPIMKQKV